MRLKELLLTQPNGIKVVTIGDKNYHIQLECRKNIINLYILNSVISIKDNSFTDVYYNNSIEELEDFIKIVEKINNFYQVKFSVFHDNLEVDDYKLSTLKLISDFKHPIEEYGFKANQPNFPFTTNLELMDSNIYYFDKFIIRFRNILRKMTIKEFIKLVEVKDKSNYDFIKLLLNNLGHLDSKIGALYDKLCVKGENYQDGFCLFFLPKLQKGLEILNFLPDIYIKII